MKIAEIIAKMLAGETLSDAETEFAKGYNPQTSIDAAAAAARREVTAKADGLQKQVDALTAEKDSLTEQLASASSGQSAENVALQAQIKTLSDSVGTLQKQLADEAKGKAALERGAKLASIRSAAGIKFIPGVSEDVMTKAFEQSFDGIDDAGLADEAITGPILERFRTANPAAIAAADGYGTGGPGHVGDGATKVVGNPWKEGTFNLSEQIEIESKDPALARRLATEAGATE